MFEGILEKVNLKFAEVSALINEIKPAAEIVAELYTGYEEALGSR